jgi:hypothetical protein
MMTVPRASGILVGGVGSPYQETAQVILVGEGEP